MAYAIGLLGFILVKVLVPGFTSRKDMKTPVRFGIYAMFANMGLNIVLVFPLEHAGLALATSLGAFLNAALLLTRLLKDKIYRPGKNWANFIVKIIFANEIMALFLFSCVEREEWFVWTAFEKVYHLGLWVAAGGLVYILSLCLIGLRPNQIFSKY
jgi:putative peptidoglycan lipid II flippase